MGSLVASGSQKSVPSVQQVGTLGTEFWLPYPSRIPTGYFRSAPAVNRIFRSDGRLDCVHLRDKMSRGWPILNGIDHFCVRSIGVRFMNQSI